MAPATFVGRVDVKPLDGLEDEGLRRRGVGFRV